MWEIRTSGSQGGGRTQSVLPTPIKTAHLIAVIQVVGPFVSGGGDTKTKESGAALTALQKGPRRLGRVTKDRHNRGRPECRGCLPASASPRGPAALRRRPRYTFHPRSRRCAGRRTAGAPRGESCAGSR